MAAIGEARHVTGPCHASIQFDPTISAPAFVDLGYSEDGFTITEQPLTVDVFSDRNGGTQGEPIDVQLMGKVAIIRGRITDFNMTTMSRLRQVATKTLLAPGRVPTAGMLLFNEGEEFRLLLQGTKDTAALSAAAPAEEPDILTPMNFNRVLFRDAWDIQSGSRVLSIELSMKAYSFVDSDTFRKIWNRDTAQ